jgi:uncharacterized protein (DUF4415 family)
MKRKMKKEYDFAKMKEVKPSYLKKLKQQVTIKLDSDVITYFKKLANELEIPYQTLMNLYLKDCSKNKKKLNLNWSRMG